MTAFADDAAYYGDGADVYPLHADIQMVDEIITIEYLKIDAQYHPVRWAVNVQMTFKNHGPAANVQMGFPLYADVGVDPKTGDAVDLGFDPHFRTWVNGEEVVVVKKHGVPNPLDKSRPFSDNVFTFTVLFDKGEVKKLRHEYVVEGYFNSINGWEFTYILRTGALWRGTIEDFKLIFRVPLKYAHEVLGTKPREQKAELAGDTLVLEWNYKQYKPKHDFTVFCGGPAFPLVSFELDRIGFNNLGAASARYLKNRIFASNGYPFKNPLVRAQFYYQGSQYKENSSFSMKRMSKEGLKIIDALSKIEEKKLKEEEAL